MSVASNRPAWEGGAATSHPALRGLAEADLCVVGLGGTGLTALAEAERWGLSAIGLDAGVVAGGAAGRNGGFLLAGLASFYHRARAALGRPRARALYELTIEQIHRIAEETPAAVRRVGSIRLAMTGEEATDCEHHLEALREDQLPASGYRGGEGTGLFLPTDAAFHPMQRCRMLADRLVERGIRLHEQSPVTSWEPGRVETTGGEVRAGIILLATDGGLGALAPQLATRLRPARLQMLATAPERGVAVPRPIYARYGMEYWQQLPDGSIALGGFRDRGGDAEWTTDSAPSEPVQAALEQFLRETIGARAPVTHRWAATVSYVDGELPVLQEIQPGVWAMGGYNGTGNVIGALCARAAVEHAVQGRSEIGELLGAGSVNE